MLTLLEASVGRATCLKAPGENSIHASSSSLAFLGLLPTHVLLSLHFRITVSSLCLLFCVCLSLNSPCLSSEYMWLLLGTTWIIQDQLLSQDPSLTPVFCIGPVGADTAEYHSWVSFWKLGSLRPRSQQIQTQFLGRTSFLVHWWPPPYVSMAEWMREHSWASFIKALIPFVRLLPSWHSHLPNVLPPPANIHPAPYPLENKFQCMNCANIQSMALHNWPPEMHAFLSCKVHNKDFPIAPTVLTCSNINSKV